MAGLKAGHYYNTFPLMDGSIIPLYLLYNQSMGIIENLFYNQATVQYIHRLLGFILLLFSLKIIFNQFRKNNLNSLDTKLATLLLVQFILGVITLVTGVNIYFAVMHQVNASLLILVCIKVIYIKKISNK
jgi:cytochrome c oxidase assembly protein subunit 15